MIIITLLTFWAGLATCYVAPVPGSALNDIVVRHYKGPELESPNPNIEKRDPPFVIDVSNNLNPAPVVTACRDINLNGPCVQIKSRPGQCGMQFFFFFSFLAETMHCTKHLKI